MGALGSRLIVCALKYYSIADIQAEGVDSDFFRGDSRKAFDYLREVEYDRKPSLKEMEDLYGIKDDDVEAEEWEHLITQVKKRHVTSLLNKRVELGVGRLEDGDVEGALEAMGDPTELKEVLVEKERTVHSIKKDGKERYKEYEKVKEGEHGYKSGWSTLDDTVGGWLKGQFYSIAGFTSVGKCIASDQRVYDPDSGDYITAEEGFKKNSRVCSVDLKKGQTEIESAIWQDTGEKECYRLTSRYGWNLESSEDHPFLTPDGFKTLGELKTGDRILRSKHLLNAEDGIVNISGNEIVIIAGLLAEGCLTRRHKSNEILFANNDEDVIKFMDEVLHIMGSGLYKRNSQKGTSNHCLLNPEKVWTILDKFGVKGVRSEHKEIPEFLMKMDEVQARIFLSFFWDCDGSVERSGHITCSSSSEKLLKQIEVLLQKLGIASFLRKKETMNLPVWELRILSESEDDFYSKIPVMTRKLNNRRTRTRDTDVKLWPSRDFQDSLISDLHNCGVTARHFSKMIERTSKKTWNPIFRSRGCSKKALKKYEGVTGRKLGFLCGDDTVWDEVESIEYIGTKHCYDLQAPKNNNFIANGFVVHNSWLVAVVANSLSYQATNEHPVLVVSTEMGGNRIGRRIDAVRHKLPFTQLRDGELGEDKETNWLEGMVKDSEDTSTGDIAIVPKKYCKTIEDVEAYVYALKPIAVIIDGAYRLTENGEWGSQVDLIEKIQEMPDKHNDLDIPWIATVQLGNRNEKGDGKGSREVDEWNVRYAREWLINPDIVLTMVQDNDLFMLNRVEFSIKKFRDGDGLRRSFQAMWDRENMDFREVAEDGEEIIEEGGELDF